MLRKLARRTMGLQGATVAAALLVLTLGADAQDRRQNSPGKFDFYVLALSWSPSYCEAAAERPPRRDNELQCGPRPFSFVVHGLWPQYERGFPEYCRRDGPRPDRATISAMLDLMPSVSLIFHEWNRHGTCSGLSPRAYFESVRRARATVTIPDAYLALDAPKMVSPGEVEREFLRANPELPAKGIAVACNGRRLSEVRICMNRDFGFRDCDEVDRRACRAARVVMPPVRGGAATR